MSASKKLLGSEKEIIRIALDKDATQAYIKMAARLKSTNSNVKIQPSSFVSYLVADFFETYFEKDQTVLVAEFFDAQGYYESQMKQAKSAGSFEQVMTETLEETKRIKSKGRRKAQGRVDRQKTQSTQSNEEI